MILTTKILTSQMQRLANFIVLEGEQGVLLVRPYTNDICAHWRFVDEEASTKSSNKIYSMFCEYKRRKDFIGMDMARKFLEMGFTRARRYANHSSGRKYESNGSVSPARKIASRMSKQELRRSSRK